MSDLELGLGDVLRARNRGLGSWLLAVKIALATTVSYLLADRFSGSSVPIFAPITTLLVVQSSLFSSIGMTLQRVVGTGLGVAVATVYVSLVPITWWSVFLALLVSLLVARALPFGIAGQLQIPLATVFVLALGPGDLRVDLWRVGDVLMGAAVGLAAMLVAPPAPQLADARSQLDAFRADVVDLLERIGDEVGTRPAALPPGTRHTFIAASRAMRARTQAVLDAMVVAAESVRFNPRARAIGTDLDRLDMRATWLRRLSIQTRGMSGAVDRLYDRDGLPPLLAPPDLRSLLHELGALLDVVDRDGSDDPDAHQLADRLEVRLRAAVEAVAHGRAAADALESLSLLGRIDHLREMAAAGPRPPDDIEAAPEDDLDEPEPPLPSRVRRLLGRP